MLRRRRINLKSVLRLSGSRSADSDWDELAKTDCLTSSHPRVVWIELTSKCPFDCIFCSRSLVRGQGEHMDFRLYGRIIRQLSEPEIIRLNYSGESIHYPYLPEAIRLAKTTGAATELVSAFAPISREGIRRLIESGLDRLTVSLHTLDAEQYNRLYRFGSRDQIVTNIHELQAMKVRLNSPTPKLDFAFVALSENLEQLSGIASFAQSVGVKEIFVHPVLRRDPIPEQFRAELETNKLTPSFRSALNDAVQRCRIQHAEVNVQVSNPVLESAQALDAVPRYFYPDLPAGGRISTCDQSPWETMHILANGDVVVCEVHDKTPMGNLRGTALLHIWNSPAYREFRSRYSRGEVSLCRTCPWKVAFRPAHLKSSISAADGGSSQLLRGWYVTEGGGAIWSKKEALLVLKAASGASGLHIRGILPPGPAGQNHLMIECAGWQIGTIRNYSQTHLPFQETFVLPKNSDDPKLPQALLVRTITSSKYRVPDSGTGSDQRELGFALVSAELVTS